MIEEKENSRLPSAALRSKIHGVVDRQCWSRDTGWPTGFPREFCPPFRRNALQTQIFSCFAPRFVLVFQFHLQRHLVVAKYHVCCLASGQLSHLSDGTPGITRSCVASRRIPVSDYSVFIWHAFVSSTTLPRDLALSAPDVGFDLVWYPCSAVWAQLAEAPLLLHEEGSSLWQGYSKQDLARPWNRNRTAAHPAAFLDFDID